LLAAERSAVGSLHRLPYGAPHHRGTRQPRGMPRRARTDLDLDGLADALRRQDGVVARWQVLALGGTRNDVRRRLARREWSRVHPGVYVDHTGPPARAQREWAAVLCHWPAALDRESALDAAGMTRDREPRSAVVHVLVDACRRVSPAEGVRVHRVTDARSWVVPNRRPPRATVEFALLGSASSRDEARAVALLSDAVHQGLTTAARLAATLRRLPRLPHRAALLTILDDVAAGTRSVLERRYLLTVERAHALPVGVRQLRHVAGSGVTYRDVVYVDHRTRVELDGAFGHRDAVDRWTDLHRDVDAAVGGVLTLRPGWAQVLEPCRLAIAVGRVLRTRGWDEGGRPCGSCCPFDAAAPDLGGSGRTYRLDPPTSAADSA